MAEDVAALLARATGFDWDDGSRPKVTGRHQVVPGECEQIFFQEPFIVSCDAAHSALEHRWRALGQTVAGRRLFVVVTVRGALIRVLAARDFNRKEKAYYAEIAARQKSHPGV